MEVAVEQMTVNAEDQARADWYAVLARLWYAPPDGALLTALARSGHHPDGQADTALGETWRALAEAAAETEPEEVRGEYDGVFISTGKAPVTLYMAHYLPGTTGKDKHLLRLRNQLQEWGLARAESVHEPEDHVAALCDAMRHLILGDASVEVALARQSSLFQTYLAPAYADFVEAVCAAAETDFYRHVARFTQVFFDIEQQALDMS